MQIILTEFVKINSNPWPLQSLELLTGVCHVHCCEITINTNSHKTTVAFLV